MKTLFLFLILFFLVGCTPDSNLIKYEYKDKDGNIHIEYIDKDVLNNYNNSKMQHNES